MPSVRIDARAARNFVEVGGAIGPGFDAEIGGGGQRIRELQLVRDFAGRGGKQGEALDARSRRLEQRHAPPR